MQNKGKKTVYLNNKMDNVIATSMEYTKFMGYFKIILA